MSADERSQRSRVRRHSRLSDVVVSTLHGAFYGIMGLLFVLMLVLGIGAAVSGAQPTHWGTFTQHGCEPGYRGRCEPVGTWVSDTGSIVKTHVQLDGFVGARGAVRASYTPTGFNNDAENNIVHVAATTGAQLWFPWPAAALVACLAVFQSRKWRRQRIHRRHLSERAARP